MASGITTGALLGASGIAALGSMLGGAVNSAMSTFQQKELMKYQAKLNYKYAKKSTLNQYGWQRQGLENAGYNPLLALNGAEGVANTGWSSASGGSSPGVDVNGAINSALSFMEQKREDKLAESQIDLNESQIQNNVANSGLVKEQIINQSISNDFQIRKAFNDLNLQNVQSGLQYAQMQEVLERTKWLSPQARATIQNLIDTGEASLVNAGASVTSAKAAMKNADTNSLDSWRNYDIKTNTRSESIGVHGPFGIGVTGSSTGYKSNNSSKMRSKGKSYYRTETLKNGKKIRVKVYN